MDGCEVSFAEAGTYLVGDVEGFFHGQGSAPVLQETVKGYAFDVFHGEELEPFVFAYVVYAHDITMCKPLRYLYFRYKPLAKRFAVNERRQHDFERFDLALHEPVRHFVYGSHPAESETFDYLEPTGDDVAGFEKYAFLFQYNVVRQIGFAESGRCRYGSHGGTVVKTHGF